MLESTDQYLMESIWSKRAADKIVIESIQGKIPRQMEQVIIQAFITLDKNHQFKEKLFNRFFSLILADDRAKPIQAVAIQMANAAGYVDPIQAFEWGIALIKICKESGLYELVQNEDEEEQWYVVPNFKLTKKARHKLGKLQYLPPMKTKPMKWVSNTSGGWFYEKKNIMLGKRFAKHNKPLAYDVLNKLQAIQWEIDTETYLYEKDTNRNLNKKQFLRVIHEYLDTPFHFVWRYDSRGRMYSSGYHLNIQSNEYGKALISLHNKENIIKLNNLYVAIANHAGKDKLTWEERIDWVKSQKTFDKVEWDEPMLGRKAVRALKNAEKGKPSGYMMSIDATSSG